jgi:predicted ATP-dependent serine protease
MSSLPPGYETDFESPLLRDQHPGDRRNETRRDAVAIAASQIKREPVTWLEHGRVPLGMVTVLGGIGGLGKSTWTCLLAARNPGVTLIATAEDSPEATVRPRLEAVQADLERARFVFVRTEDGIEDGIAIPDDVARLEELVAETGATLVVVDPLVAHLPAHIDSHKDQSVRRALAPLYRLAKTQGCAVVALIHLNKAQGLAPLARLTGSGAFGNAARSVLLLERDPDDDENGRRRVLAHIKCNVGPEMPSLLYEIEPILLPENDGQPRVETSRLQLLGECDHDARALLATSSEGDRSALAEAIEFLTAELGDGERRLANEVMRSAKSLGYSVATIHRARKKLGVETEKAGFGRGWEWWVPKISSGLEPSRVKSSEKPFADEALELVRSAEDSTSSTRNLQEQGAHGSNSDADTDEADYWADRIRELGLFETPEVLP